MTRSQHKHIVAKQRAELAQSDAEMRRLLQEAQQWVNRLRTAVNQTIKEGQGNGA